MGIGFTEAWEYCMEEGKMLHVQHKYILANIIPLDVIDQIQGVHRHGKILGSFLSFLCSVFH